MTDTENHPTSEIFKILTTDSFLKFYRTPTIITSQNLEPSISVIKEIPFLMIPNIHSFTIYNLQDLKTQFISDCFEEITSIAQAGVFVYVASSNCIFKTLRGEIISKIEIGKIVEMIKFGIYLVAVSVNELIVFEYEDNSIEFDKNEFLVQDQMNKNRNPVENHKFKELYRIKYESKIKAILHPNTYVNKILIIFENGTGELFNLSSKKLIFKYNFGQVSCVAQTDILDVIALGMNDGSIKVYNLKKDKQLLVIDDFVGFPIKQLSFKNNFATILSERFILYNLELKKEVYSRENCYHSIVLNENTALLTSKNSIEILNLEDFTILKSRKILNENIKSLTCYSKTEILVNSEDQLFRMNLYRDEMNRFLKTKGLIEKISADNTGRVKMRSNSLINSDIDGNPLFNSNILLYGDNKLTYIDRELKWHIFINLKCKFIKIFKDFCLLGTNTQILIMNIKSKRVVCTLKLEEMSVVVSGDLDNDSFILLFSDKIQTYDFDLKLISNIDLSNNFSGSSISKQGNMFFLQNNEKNNLLVINSDPNSPISRSFEIENFAVDSKILIGTAGTKIKIFDLQTGSLIDIVETNKKLRDITILDDFKFVAVLDDDSNVHILSNQSHFNSIVNSKLTGISNTKLNIPTVKKDNNFYKELLISKNFNAANVSELNEIIQALSKDEANEMLKMIHKNLKNEFFGTQKLLSKLLLFKNKDLDAEIVKEIEVEVGSKLKEIEQKALKTLGFLSLNRIN